LCADGCKHLYGNTARHENSAYHKTLVEEAAKWKLEESEGLDANQPGSMVLPPFLGIIDSGTRNLLKSLTGSSPSCADDSDTNHPERAPDSFPVEGWGLFEANEETNLALSLEQQGIALIAQSLLDRFDELSVRSADDGAERSEDDEDEVPEPTFSIKHACFFSR
jgi:hypothetical protein